jgi:hypothetical protein
LLSHQRIAAPLRLRTRLHSRMHGGISITGHLDSLIQDLRYSLRFLLRARTFTATVLVTLANEYRDHGRCVHDYRGFVASSAASPIPRATLHPSRSWKNAPCGVHKLNPARAQDVQPPEKTRAAPPAAGLNKRTLHAGTAIVYVADWRRSSHDPSPLIERWSTATVPDAAPV